MSDRVPSEFTERARKARRLCASGLAAIALAIAGLIAAAPAGASQAPTLSPLPGTRDANPESQISILGVARKDIKSVSVTGTTSGKHRGSLQSYESRTGASFVLDQPFDQGEDVTAKVSYKGGTAKTKFTVATFPSFIAPFLGLTNFQPDKQQHFQSEPGLIPPRITVKKNAPSASDDSIFLTPLPSPTVQAGNNVITINPIGPGGPMIVDHNGNLVWWKQLTDNNVAANLQVQDYDGKKVLTWWEGKVRAWAYGEGDAVIANHHYKEIARFSTGNGYRADLHEFSLTPQGDALMTIYSPVCVTDPCNVLTPDESQWPLIDGIIQLVDPKTGLVEWEWHALDHIPVDDTVVIPAGHILDAYHVNSIQQIGGGKILASLRDTSSVYKIDRSTGKIDWTLGGEESDFKMGTGATFNYQHDARMLPNGQISLFDDAAGPPVYDPGYSRGLILDLNEKKHKATVAHEYARNTETLADSEGSVQRLDGGNQFVGFGSTPFFSEFKRNGKKVFDAKQPNDNGSYRVFRFPWTATPKTDPAIALGTAAGGKTAVYASWNGATKVAKWNVVAGPGSGSLKKVASAGSTGFETEIDVPGTYAFYAVQALDSKGKVLAQSPVRTPTP